MRAASMPQDADRIDLRRGVLDARRKLLRGEAAEHDRVDRADAGAGQHGDGGLGDHRHVEDDPVALSDAHLLQDGAERRRLVQQLAVGERALRARDRAVVDDRRLLAPPCATWRSTALWQVLHSAPTNQRP